MLGRRIIPGPNGLADLRFVLGTDHARTITQRFLFGVDLTWKFSDSLNDTSSNQGKADTARGVKFFVGIFQAELQEGFSLVAEKAFLACLLGRRPRAASY